jgi:hypothetical protein
MANNAIKHVKEQKALLEEKKGMSVQDAAVLATPKDDKNAFKTTDEKAGEKSGERTTYDQRVNAAYQNMIYGVRSD